MQKESTITGSVPHIWMHTMYWTTDRCSLVLLYTCHRNVSDNELDVHVSV